MPLQVWQVKEAKKLKKSGQHLAQLALNSATSNESFYRAAIYEAVNIHRRKKARERRAIEAGLKISVDDREREVNLQRNAEVTDKNSNKEPSNGVEVLNKDTIDPQTVKRLGKQQVDDILAICKRHKWLVDTAAASVDTKLEPIWEARLSSNKLALQRKKILRSRKLARQARILSENNERCKSSGYGSVSTNVKTGRKKTRGHRTDSDKYQDSTAPGGKLLLGSSSHTIPPTRDEDTFSSSGSQLSSSHISTSTVNGKKMYSPLPKRFVRDELPAFDFPLTLKNFNTQRVVQGWEHGAKKLEWLIRTAVSALDTSEPESRRRLREDKERKALMARKTGLGDPDDIRPGEYGLSFSEKTHWRLHLDQLRELIETAPVRISASIDPHVQRVWNLNRKRGIKDVEKTKGMSTDFALSLKREATREQLQSWSDSVEQLWEMCAKAKPRIDNDWGVHGPPRSIRGQGTKRIPNPSVSSRKGHVGGAGRWGQRSRGSVGKSSSGSSLPELPLSRNRKTSSKQSLAKGLRKSLGEKQLQVSCIDGLEHADGLAISMQFFLGGKHEIRKQIRKGAK